ncbi:unnamed protein product [Sphagnum tenellum]
MVAMTFNALDYEPKVGGAGNYLGIGTFLVEAKEIEEFHREINGHNCQELVISVECVEAQNPDDIGKRFAIKSIWVNPGNAAWEKNERNKIAAVTAAVGAPTFWNDTDVLLNIPFVIELVEDKKNPQYPRLGNIYDANGEPPAFNQQTTKAPTKTPTKVPSKPAPLGEWAVGREQGGPVDVPQQAPVDVPTSAEPVKPGWATKFKK